MVEAIFENIADTYKRYPMTIVRGEGTRLWDSTGREYLDLVSGIAVCNLGHCHPELIRAAEQGLRSLWHVSNLYFTEPQARLAKALCNRSFGERVFFCNSGAEAVEAAFKLMRRYGHETKGPGAYEVVALENSFHGRTLGALSLTGQAQYRGGFTPLVPGVTFVPRNDERSLELAVGRRTCGIILEPIQGEGGVYRLTDGFLQLARELCDRHGLLLCFDEVQVGMGRTGRLFAYENTQTLPDIMCLAKALGNGLPIGAMIARADVMTFLSPGTHASTFGGNPVITQVAERVVEILGDEGFLSSVREKGLNLSKGLLALMKEFPDIIEEVRGQGLIQAVEFKRPLEGIWKHFMDEGMLVLCPRNQLLRLLPPLIIDQKDIDRFLEVFQRILRNYHE